MSIELAMIKGRWPLVRHVPAILIRWYFTPKKLAQLVYVDLFPRNESAVIDLAANASFRLHLQVINLSPYPIKLEQANFCLRCGAVALKTTILKKQTIAPGEIASLFLEEAISDSHANQVHKNFEMNQTTLEGNIEFSSALHAFAKTIGQLSGVQAKLISANSRNAA